MVVVEVLSDKGMWLHGEVLIDLGHVHVVDEVDQAASSGRTEVAASLLLQRLLQHTLCKNKTALSTLAG